jgi:hypothetical protein
VNDELKLGSETMTGLLFLATMVCMELTTVSAGDAEIFRSGDISSRTR